MRTVRATLREFWGFVVETPNPDTTNTTNTTKLPCWEWIGSTAYNGYMAFRSVLAHRAAATIYCGKIPSSVSQRCGNRKCVRLEHLAIAHKTETTEDRYTPVHKQEETITSILQARGSDRYTLEGISEKTGCKLSTIKKVLRESPLYDLLADITHIRSKGLSIQTKPKKEVAVA